MVESRNFVSPRSRLLEALEDAAVQYRRTQDLTIDGKPALQIIEARMDAGQYENVVTAMGDDLIEGIPAWAQSNERPAAVRQSADPTFILRA